MSDHSLKPGWQMYRFDQIAINVNDRVEPGDTDAQYYVGLEHLDSDSLKIRRWGQPSEVEATKLRFQKGDIIFGRRRAYQRKLGVAEFDGICSAHAMVLRPKTDVVLPEFLPFFMQSDLFMNRALEISVGSLSPTINWRTLAEQEFALPPLVEQCRMAEVFWAIEDVFDNLRIARDKLAKLKIVIIEDAISSIQQIVSFGDLLSDVSYGSSDRASYDQDGVPILRIPNVLREEIDLSDLKWVKLTQEEIERYSVRDGDILIVRTNGNPEYVGRCVVAHNQPEPMTYASYLIRLRVKQEIANADYIATILNSLTLRQQIRGSVRSSAGNYNINSEGIRRQQIPLTELSKQEELVQQLSLLRASQDDINKRYETTHQLKKQLLSELGG